MIPVSRPSVGPGELASIGKVLESGWLGMGATTYSFEEETKKLIGSKHVIAVNTGTSALHLALDGFGVGPDDEVIVPSITYAASIQAIISTGAVPVFCESQEADLLMDVEDLKHRITERTKAVMPVHYCGQACDMDPLLELAEKNGFWVIEDAAHAFSSTYKGRKIGSFGHATCFSFDPIKIITCGEGGAVSLQDNEKAEMIRRKRILGIDKDTWHRYKNTRSWFYEVTTIGYRYHMPNFCAAIGLTQLTKIEEFIRKRREICRRYDSSFMTLRNIRPLRVNYDEVAPFMYIVRVLNGKRDAFIDRLKQHKVDTGIHYIPNHIHPFFKKYVRKPLDRSAELGEQIVTLPLYYDMTEMEIQTVIESVLDFEKAA
jgi:perosamine synthetase